MSGDALEPGPADPEVDPIDYVEVAVAYQDDYFRHATKGREDKLTEPANLRRVLHEVAHGVALARVHQLQEDNLTIASLNRVHERLKLVEALIGKAPPEISVDYDGERQFTIAVSYAGSKSVSSFVLPMMIDRGIWREGVAYQRGDTVTFDGSIWCATDATKERPGSGRTAWRLSCKRGRDGRDAAAPT